LVPVLFFVITITFVLMHLAPGSPWDKEGKQLSAAVVRNLNAKYGLSDPFFVQYLRYLWNVAHFDFGLSFQYEDQAVSSLILRSWPPTAVIGTLAFVMIVIFGSASASSPLSDKTPGWTTWWSASVRSAPRRRRLCSASS